MTRLLLLLLLVLLPERLSAVSDTVSDEANLFEFPDYLVYLGYN